MPFYSSHVNNYAYSDKLFIFIIYLDSISYSNAKCGNDRDRLYLNFYFQEFTVGDRVSVIVPKNERPATDVSRMPGEVIDIRGCGLYGTLAAHNRGGDIQYHGTLQVDRDR